MRSLTILPPADAHSERRGQSVSPKQAPLDAARMAEADNADREFMKLLRAVTRKKMILRKITSDRPTVRGQRD